MTPGISFAIPIDYAKEFLRKSKERAKGGWLKQGEKRFIGIQIIIEGDINELLIRFLGITMVSLNHQLLEELRLRTQLPPSVTHGILVYKVDRGINPNFVLFH